MAISLSKSDLDHQNYFMLRFHAYQEISTNNLFTLCRFLSWEKELQYRSADTVTSTSYVVG